MGESLEG